jgi:hypothetical protein
VSLVAEGDRVGSGSRLTLTTSTGRVSYVVTADASWAMPEGRTWQQLDADPADVDTIAALRQPSAVRLEASDGTTTRLTVTVPRPVLGLGADGTADLDVSLVGGAVRSIAFASAVQGRPAQVTSVFGPAQDASPVAPPVTG